MFIYYLVACLVVLLSPSMTSAACGGSTTVNGSTYTAYDVSYDCVNAAVTEAQAGYGNEVVIPAGTSTWPDTSKMSITKGISVRGNGVGSTIITAGSGDNSTSSGNNIISIAPDSTTIENQYPITLSGMELRHSSGLYTLVYINNPTSSPYRKLRIHHCAFLGNASGVEIGIVQGRNIFGVVDNNTFSNLSHAWRLLVANTDGWTLDEEWVPGTDNAMYYEDNSLTHSSGCILVSGGRGLRMVARYNNLNSATTCFPNFDIHGIQVAAGIGYELYGNTVLTVASSFLGQRGGQVFLFGNNAPNDTNGVTYEQRTEWHSDYNDGLDANPGTTYKTTALGNYDQNVHWSYRWCNYYDTEGASKSWLSQSLTDVEDTWQRDGALNDPLTIVENQSHWVHRPAVEFSGLVSEIGSCGKYGAADCTASGVGCGTLAAMQAIETCTTGVGYWATDQSCYDLTGMVGANPTTPISGTLYKCTSTDTWEAYYTPYTYPHPLRGIPTASTSHASGSFNLR